MLPLPSKRPINSGTLLGLSLAWILCLGSVGCESNPTDDSPNVFPTSPDILAQQQETTESGTSCSSCPAVGDWYRFDTLAVSELDYEINPVTDVLNPVWENDIKFNELNIIFQVIEVTAEQVQFRAVNAARVGTEGEMCLMTETEIDVTMNRNACALESDSASSMNIYAGTQNNPKICVPDFAIDAIAVQGVKLAADFTEDCGQMISGEIVEAYLPKASLDGTCSCITTGTALSDEACISPDPAYEDKDCGGCNKGFVALNVYLKAFSPGGTMKYLCETDDGNQAVCLNGTFSATRLAEAIPDCPSP